MARAELARGHVGKVTRGQGTRALHARGHVGKVTRGHGSASGTREGTCGQGDMGTRGSVCLSCSI